MESSDHSSLDGWLQRARLATEEAHEILSKFEQTRSRIVHLDDLLRKLKTLPVDILSYFQESVECLEYDLRRAAIVMAWAGYFHVFSENLYTTHESDIRKMRPKWKFSDFDELKESRSESAIIDVAKEVKYIKKAFHRILQGHLSTRNQCAHPSTYRPTRNYAIGYVDEVINNTLILL